MDAQALKPAGPHQRRYKAADGQLMAVDAERRQVATPLRHRQQGRVVQLRWAIGVQ